MIANLKYNKPKAISELGAFKDLTNLQILAGGTLLIPRLKNMKPSEQPLHVLDIKGLEELKKVKMTEKGMEIGSAVTITDMLACFGVVKNYPVLIQLMRRMGNRQMRNRATIGGNICAGIPAGDLLVALFVLGAKVVSTDLVREETVALEEIFRNGHSAYLEKRIILKVVIPPLPETAKVKYFSFRKKNNTPALVNIAVYYDLGSDSNICRTVRVAAGGLASQAARAPKTEALLHKDELSDVFISEVMDKLVNEFNPKDSRYATAVYRSEMIKILLKKALVELKEGKQGV